jgi:hypothetical protein
MGRNSVRMNSLMTGLIAFALSSVGFAQTYSSGCSGYSAAGTSYSGQKAGTSYGSVGTSASSGSGYGY